MALLRSLRQIQRGADVSAALESQSFQTGAPGTVSGGALALPAFYRGVSIRSGVLSTIPLAATAAGRVLDVAPPILEQPDPSEDRQVTLSRMANSLTLRGEYVAVIGQFDDDGYPQAIKVVDPTDAVLNSNGTWTIAGKTFSRDEILHRLVLALPGEARGISVVELFRRVLQGELAAQEFQRRYYLDGGMPTAVVTVNKPDVQPADLEKFKLTWREKMASRREPVFLPGDTTVQPLFISNRDAQWLEGRQFALTDIANIVGLPPYFLGAPGSSATYANISDQRRDLLDLYLRGDVYSIERGLSDLLPDGIKAKYQVDSFLRLDPKATAETMAIESQWMTVDELRHVKGLDPLPNGQGRQLGSLVLPGAPQAQPTEGATQ